MVETMRQTYACVYLLATVATAWVGIACWRDRRAVPVAPGIAAVLWVGSWWCACDLVLTVASTGPAGRVALACWLPCLALAVPAYAFLVELLVRPRRRVPPIPLAAVCAYAVLVVAVVAVPAGRELFVRPVGRAQGPLLPWEKGPLFWAVCVVDVAATLLLCLGVARLLPQATPTRRRQLLAVLASVLAILGGAVWAAASSMHPETTASAFFDYSALGWTAAAVIFLWWLLTSGTLAPSHPVRSAVFDELGDAVLVLDGAGRVVEMNRAARALVGEERIHARGVGPVLDRLGLGDDPSGVLGGAGSQAAGGVQVSVSPLRRDGEDLGSMLVLRDVTEHVRARAALLESNLALRDELDALEVLGRGVADAALVDDVTGLPNRRHLTDVVDAVVGEALEHSPATPCAVLRVEVECLDAITRERGPAVRDDVLRHVGAALLDVRPPLAVVTRVGPAGFAVVLPGSGAAAAAACAADLDAVLAVRPVRGTLVRVGTGWAALTEPMEPYALLTRADEALRPAPGRPGHR